MKNSRAVLKIVLVYRFLVMTGHFPFLFEIISACNFSPKVFIAADGGSINQAWLTLE